MKSPQQQAHAPAAAPWAAIPWPRSSLLLELPVLAGGLALLYSVVVLAHYWAKPFTPQVEISLSSRALPLYALYSILRIAVAYFLSLAFTLVYGYIAAYNKRAELFMVPLLDVLQSIPVLSFLPGVMLAMVALFPHRQFGLELGAILLIFTAQFGNMAFSFYSSLKNIPNEMREAARLYGFNWWQSFIQMELPYSVIGLVWNSMMSVAGAWFFLMACEMFVLGKRDFRLPGLGSYLQTAASAGNTGAILSGVVVLIIVIVLTDQLVWRPVIAWAEKFKFESVEAAESHQSSILNLLRRSSVIAFLSRRSIKPIEESISLYLARKEAHKVERGAQKVMRKWLLVLLGGASAAGIVYAIWRSGVLLSGLSHDDLKLMLLGAGTTFLRVAVCLLIGTLWTVPVGVAIGTHPKLARVAQPLAQIAASVPATALFPIVLLALVQVGGGLGIGSILLLLLGTQWYILFNVIAGASAMPTDLQEVCSLYRFSRLERWRKFIMPAIFPYLITGLVTASGGAWNASIVAEYFHLHGKIYSTTGLGALISQATDDGNSARLLAATICMAAIVAVINRMVWRRLYRLAATRFKLG
ncbi:MAG TPA: ABC transporter permease subunit [Candidatus Angelobacter sp.]|nr:ABC transporter permease subunit [Candidatus Angelobacter sp.]